MYVPWLLLSPHAGLGLTYCSLLIRLIIEPIRKLCQLVAQQTLQQAANYSQWRRSNQRPEHFELRPEWTVLQLGCLTSLLHGFERARVKDVTPPWIYKDVYYNSAFWVVREGGLHILMF
jgi:hypothetical protein